MGGFGSGDWADLMTRKVNTGLCRTLSVKRLKKMGVFDADRVDERFSIRWVNGLGEDAGMVSIIPQVSVGGNGNKIFLRVDIGGIVICEEKIHWDLVVDCIGFEAEDAQTDIQLFRDRAEHLVFISSDFVFNPKHRTFPQSEDSSHFTEQGTEARSDFVD